MTEIDNRYVKSGYWINVDAGPGMGGTITTDVSTGTFIVALLAILSSLGVSHLWNLVTFVCHQIRAHGRKSDALYWQQQALLRSQLPPFAFLADWIKLWWVWRKKAKCVAARSFFYIPLSLVFTASVIAVGIFSSFIIDSSNLQVLASNPKCGYLDLDLIGDHIGEYKREIYKRSESYADECYGNSTHLPVRCSIFLRPNLALTPERVPCPFDKSVCIDYNTTGVSVDSGLVNANSIIGWNLDLQDQVKFRRKATCGVLKTRDYSQIIYGSDYPFPNRRKFLPGEQLLVSRYWQNDDPRIWQNVTFVHSLLQANISDTYSSGAAFMFKSPLRNKPRQQVISGLTPEKGDLALTQIRPNNVRYTQPVNDPVFAAHQPVSLYTIEHSKNMTQYLSDWPASTIGCIQQYQYCILRNGQSDLCTELSGLPLRIDHEQLPGASDTQLVALKLIVDANYLSDSTDASRSLEARKLLDAGYMIPLPDDQWINEVVGWEKILWASFQIILSDYAIGYGLRDAKVGHYIRKPSRPGERKLCGSQRMQKSGGFVNINVFGLAFVTTVSFVVTLLDIVLLKFVLFLQSFRQVFSPRIDRWVQDGVFQLQRRAFESQGQGIWTRREKEIPTMDEATELDELGDQTSKTVCTCASSVATKHARSYSLSSSRPASELREIYLATTAKRHHSI